MMLRLLKVAGVVALLGLPAGSALAQEELPECAAGDDYDADGVPNLDDSDETDSCQLDPRDSGLTDCQTGAGDGVPDCRIPDA